MFPVDIIIRVDEKKENDSGEYTFQCKALGELVRCGECKHWEEESTFCLNKEGCYGSETTADWFCADGERKEKGDA